MSEPSEAMIEAARKIFLAGHSEGWTGNQRRRDVQHVDAQKGWEAYVQNGALQKVLAARPTVGDEQLLREARFAVDRCRAIIKFNVKPERCVTMGNGDVVSARVAFELAVGAIAKIDAALARRPLVERE